MGGDVTTSGWISVNVFLVAKSPEIAPLFAKTTSNAFTMAKSTPEGMLCIKKSNLNSEKLLVRKRRREKGIITVSNSLEKSHSCFSLKFRQIFISTCSLPLFCVSPLVEELG